MAIALAGIPWLAGILGGIASALIGFFSKFVTARLAVVAAGVVIIVSLTAGLFAALEGLLAGLTYVMPSEIAEGVALVTPGNLTTCLSIIITAHMLRYAYDWNVRVLQYKFKF